MWAWILSCGLLCGRKFKKIEITFHSLHGFLAAGCYLVEKKNRSNFPQFAWILSCRWLSGRKLNNQVGITLHSRHGSRIAGFYLIEN